MKHLNAFATLLLLSALPLMGADKIVPESCSIGDRPFVHPLEFVDFYFDGAVALGHSHKAYIKDGNGDIVIESEGAQSDNYVGSKRTQGRVVFFFDKFLLPLGKDYTVVVEPGAIIRMGESDICNDEISVQFTVPADLGDIRPYINIGGVEVEKPSSDTMINSASSVCVYWWTETRSVCDPQWKLYRNGELEGTYPAYVTWDWDLGQAYAEFGENKRFDKGALYTLVLPAKSVVSEYRDDIFNREVRIEFTGGSEAPEPGPLQFSWCSLYTDHSKVLDKVWFRYDEPIEVSADAYVELYELRQESDADVLVDVLVKKAPAWLDTSINCFNLCADFGGFEMKDNTGYYFVIPEGTVSSILDDRTNKRQSMAIDNTSGVEAISVADTGAEPLYDLNGRLVMNPQPNTIYVRSGRKIIWK